MELLFMWITGLVTVVTVYCNQNAPDDTYFEHLSVTPLSDGKTIFYEFSFEITTTRKNYLVLDIFPQPIAAVLGGPHAKLSDLVSIEASIGRGQWKPSRWGPSVMHRRYPSGSSLAMAALRSGDNNFSKSDDSFNQVWAQTAWMFSNVLGGSFESLGGPHTGSDQYRWIRSFDMPDWADKGDAKHYRINSNPNEPCCTENLERFLELLPCRGNRGLGKLIMTSAQLVADSEYMGMVIKGENSGDRKRFKANFFFTSKDTLSSALNELNQCIGVKPVITTNTRNMPISLAPAHSSGSTLSYANVTVARSIVNALNRPEKRQGRLLVHITNNDSDKPVNVEYYDQMPFFLTPLWHTQKTLLSDSSQELTVETRIAPGDGAATPTYILWNLTVPPMLTATILVDVYKRFIPFDKFSFSFEKGFDLGSAVVRVNQTDWFLTRGLVVITPQPDATATFNVITLSCTVISLFFGMVFRNWNIKRSVIVGTDPESVAQRQGPLMRLIHWLLSLLRRRRSS